jgi:poly(A) polymerase
VTGIVFDRHNENDNENFDFSLALIGQTSLDLLKKIYVYFQSLEVEAYLVGGFIRNALLGRETADIDLAISGDALDTAGRLANHLKGTYVLLDSVNKVGRVVLKPINQGTRQTNIDISTLCGTLESDLSRRDFTINALALSLREVVTGGITARLIDPHRGRQDLDRGIIRSIKERNLSDDPVRLLRGVRLSVELGFQVETLTRLQIKNFAPLLAMVPGERIREELLRVFSAARGGQFIFNLDELGIINALFPELAGTKGVSQPAEHYWDVFTHSVMTVSAIDYLLRQGFWIISAEKILEFVPWSEKCAVYFEEQVSGGSNRRTMLKIAALFHDIAKPQTKAKVNGRTRFLGHQDEGAEIASRILERLRFTSRENKIVANVVKYHLRPTQMGQQPTHRAIYRYFRDVGNEGIDTLYLSLADHLATRGPALIITNWHQHTDTVRYILEEHFKQETIIKPPRLIDGNDIMNIFGLKPGPKVGELLELVREAYAAGELTTREQALEYIHNVLTEGKN